MAVENHDQGVEQLERKVAILTELAEISTVLNSTLHLEPLLEFLMDKAAEITDCESASVLLWNHNTHELFFAATSSKDSNSVNLIGQPVPLNSIAGTILREERIIAVDDVAQDSRHYAKVGEDAEVVIRSLMGVPMTAKNKLIGVLEVINKRQLPWTEEDRHYLSVLAAQAAVAIESAQLVKALRKANDDLSQLDKLKNDFIAIASHELRTPLGVILGYASFLQEDTRDEEVSDLASKVMASGLQLRQIIEGMINLRYLKQNESELYREPVLLTDLLEDIQRDMLELVEAKGHTLVIEDIPPDTYLYVDRTRATMGLTNILNNAVRFTPSGGTITIATDMTHADEIWISVTDNGIGLAEDKLEKIFDEFYQVEDHLTRQHGGLGIGLSITRAFAKAHGGRIWAESPGLNQGATFTLTLPLHQDAAS